MFYLNINYTSSFIENSKHPARSIVHVAVGIPILSCKMPQCVQEKAKSAESALDEGIPESCWERTQR